MWRAADLVREHRGDSHVISWAVGGADAVEVLLLTEQWWGLPARSYAPSRGWQGPDMDAGFERLERRGLMKGEELTDAGRAFREEIEVRTDELERPVLDALGDDLDELLGYLDVWSDAIIAGGSYPQRIAGVYNVGGGPHFGAGLTIDSAAEQYTKEGMTEQPRSLLELRNCGTGRVPSRRLRPARERRDRLQLLPVVGKGGDVRRRSGVTAAPRRDRARPRSRAPST